MMRHYELQLSHYEVIPGHSRSSVYRVCGIGLTPEGAVVSATRIVYPEQRVVGVVETTDNIFDPAPKAIHPVPDLEDTLDAIQSKLGMFLPAQLFTIEAHLPYAGKVSA